MNSRLYRSAAIFFLLLGQLPIVAHGKSKPVTTCSEFHKRDLKDLRHKSAVSKVAVTFLTLPVITLPVIGHYVYEFETADELIKEREKVIHLLKAASFLEHSDPADRKVQKKRKMAAAVIRKFYDRYILAANRSTILVPDDVYTAISYINKNGIHEGVIHAGCSNLTSLDNVVDLLFPNQTFLGFLSIKEEIDRMNDELTQIRQVREQRGAGSMIPSQ